MKIVLETETPGDSRTMFRLLIDSKLIAAGLTAVQAHILVGEILERISVPKERGSPKGCAAQARLTAMSIRLRRPLLANRI